MIDLRDRPCEVCDATDSELLWTTTWPEHDYPGEFSMRRCESCGLLFNSPRLDDQQLAQLYGRNYYFFNRSDACELARIVPMYQRTIGLVADQMSSKRSLDIGCGRGYLPAVLKALGWDARGVEISSEAADSARSRFGIDVFTGTIEQYTSSSSEKFPLVTAIDVIEHVPSPQSFARAITQVVEPGGLVILDTPNAAARNIESKRVEWGGFNPFHIFLFTIGNLSKLLERNGMTIERAFSYNNLPQARSIRDAFTRTLKKVGMIRPAARMYFALRGSMQDKSPALPALHHAVELIRSQPSWHTTADASAPLASDNRGDNIVLIARRVEG